MGRDKAALPFGAELMLPRVVRLVGEAVGLPNVVVVAAPGQAMPALPREVAVVRDALPHLGPLSGLAAGLRAVGGRVDAAYASGCDAPLVAPALVEHLFGALGEYDIAVPRDGEFHHPLAAVYRPGVLAKVEALVAAGRLRPRYLFDEVRTQEIPVEELRRVDAELRTLWNVNSPEEYHAALAAAGLGPTPDA